MEKEIISRFRDKPKKIAWWTMAVGLSTLIPGSLLIIFATVIRPYLNVAISENIGAIIGFWFMIITLIIIFSAITLGYIGYRKGERSWVCMVRSYPSNSKRSILVFYDHW